MTDFMIQIQENMRRGIQRASDARRLLEIETHEGGRLENTGIHFVEPADSFAFRCHFGDARYGLSISFMSMSGTGTYCETALFERETGNLAYVYEWQYADVIPLESFDDLINEIIRIRREILNAA